MHYCSITEVDSTQGKFFREFHSAIDAEGYDLENKQIFADSMVTLGDLRVVIQAMGEVLVNYNLLSVRVIIRHP